MEGYFTVELRRRDDLKKIIADIGTIDGFLEVRVVDESGSTS